ncbi:uncharacterized protein [Spinacia oleracea]|uniref:GRF-type domain-containing protein n=1 Tax=Spinacia oleracea TaxID=3562 RepID=A0ABM3QSM8_SPIOL|nr:uncharacterized protein LOC130462047 [Spinacia oleracea]
MVSFSLCSTPLQGTEEFRRQRKQPSPVQVPRIVNNTNANQKTEICACGFPVVQRTSWTHENPGRKFKGCKFYNFETGQRDCNAFDWVDEYILGWQKDVTNHLLWEKAEASHGHQTYEGKS